MMVWQVMKSGNQDLYILMMIKRGNGVSERSSWIDESPHSAILQQKLYGYKIKISKRNKINGKKK